MAPLDENENAAPALEEGYCRYVVNHVEERYDLQSCDCGDAPQNPTPPTYNPGGKNPEFVDVKCDGTSGLAAEPGNAGSPDA